MKRNLVGVSMFTVVTLYVFLSFVMIILALILDFPIYIAAGINIVIIILQFLIAPFFTDLLYRIFYKAKFDHEIPEYLSNFIKEVCENNKMKYPRIGYIDDGTPNACCYGRGKNSARIIVTRGIFDLLDEEEVKSVVGHEMGHAVHYDMLFMTAVALIPQLFYMIYSIFTDSDSSSNSKNGSYTALIALIAYVLYIITRYIMLWLSRVREYYADEFSLQQTKNPNAMATALVKVGFGLVAKSDKKHSASTFGARGLFDSKTSKELVVTTNNQSSKESVKNAMKWDMWNVWAKWFEFNSTHPLISKRLLRISEYSRQYNQEPYIEFDLKQPESYVDDFFIELLIAFAPGFIFLIGLIITILFLLVTDNLLLIIPGITGILMTVTLFIKLNRVNPNKGYSERVISDLIGEVKVSGITSIPCIVKGKLIGKGNPGYVFSEDYTLQDNTGIIMLNYNQPLGIMNLFHAIFKNSQNLEKEAVIKGWYRRSPVPYIEILNMEVEGKTYKVHTYALKKVGLVLLLLLSIGIMFL